MASPPLVEFYITVNIFVTMTVQFTKQHSSRFWWIDSLTVKTTARREQVMLLQFK
jgi:hypothetical protein